jgi:hypothetical protein
MTVDLPAPMLPSIEMNSCCEGMAVAIAVLSRTKNDNEHKRDCRRLVAIIVKHKVLRFREVRQKKARVSRPELQKRRGRDAFGGRDLMLWKEISEKSRLAIRRSPASRAPTAAAGEASDRLRRGGLLVVLIRLLDVEPL